MIRFIFSLVLAIAAVLTVAVIIPFSIVAAGFWAADGSWDFEGRGIKYWMFVQGSRLERLGTVEPVGAVKYSISLQEGTFPGWNIASYESAATPEKIMPIYAARCAQMKLKISENKSEQKQGSVRAEMICEIQRYLDVEIVAERDASAALSSVIVKVWGSE